jgi:hypothetical protein
LSVAGSPEAWIDLLERMLPDLLQLTIEAWVTITRPFVDDKEDHITGLLCRALRHNRTARQLPFLIHPQMVELDPAPGLRVPVECDHGFRWKMITQSGGT